MSRGEKLVKRIFWLRGYQKKKNSGHGGKAFPLCSGKRLEASSAKNQRGRGVHKFSYGKKKRQRKTKVKSAAKRSSRRWEGETAL